MIDISHMKHRLECCLERAQVPIRRRGAAGERTGDMLERFLKTDASKPLYVQRALLGAVMLPHRAQKLLAAFGAAVTMVGAVLTTHLKVGFFMNWFGNQSGEGLEYHLLALALALPLVVRGGGASSF